VETGDVLGPGAAAASVRPARPADATAIGAVQVRCWRREYAGVLPAGLLEGLRGDEFAAPWHTAVTAPPSPRHAVLVACAGQAVVGFAALAPSADGAASATDAELVALEVDPVHQRAGHGSRLLAAVADTARDHGFTALRAWVPAASEARRAFLTSAGPSPDGARRRLRPATASPGTEDPAAASPGTEDPAAASPGTEDPAEVVEERLVALLTP
jgi:GNAT superfamily N-acetyltransferase